MDQDAVVSRFEKLRQQYDDLHRPGAWLRLKDELGLGSGVFNDRLTPTEVEKLNQELEIRLAGSR